MSNGEFSATRLARAHDVMAGYVERGVVPGLVTAISRRGEIHVEAIGAQDFDGKTPMRRDSIFRISSMSKPITAAATMILVEECKLRLDEPVDRLLPELANRRVLKRLDGPVDDTVPANRPITVRDLLTFRMGFGLLFGSPDQYPILGALEPLALGQGQPHPAAPPEPDEWMRRFATLPLMHQPGERWMYNTGADVLSVLIARASGQPLETFLRERLFEPLGMNDTGFSVPAEKVDRFTPSYATDFATGERFVYDPATDGEWNQPPAFPSGAAGLVSTADDYLAFGQMMLNHGKLGNVRILSRPSVELMTSDHLTPEQKAVSGLGPGFFDSHGWGFCVSVVTRRENLTEHVGHYGWSGGMGTIWGVDPTEEMTTVLMTPRVWDSPEPPAIVQDFLTSTYQAIDD